MASILIVVAVVVVAAATGLVELIGLVALGTSLLVVVTRHRDRLLPIAAMSWLAVLAYEVGLARGGWAGVLLAAGVTYATKSLIRYRPSASQSWWPIAIPAAIVASLRLVSDSDVRLAAGIWFALTVPDPFPGRLRWFSLSNRAMWAGALATAGAALVALPLLGTMPSMRRTAYIELGVWGRATPPLVDGAALDESHMYSYSWLASLTGADLLGRPDLNRLSEYDEAILVTPTESSTSAELEALHDWVVSGGHLIVIVDHTDLFGHGRVTQAILARFSMQNGLTALFPMDQRSEAQILGFQSRALKTATVVSGTMAWPVSSARWIEELPDYGGRNFFGQLRPSDEDGFGRKAIGLTARRGCGQITVWGDSTIFANFAIFQPGYAEVLTTLRSPSVFSRVGVLVIGILLLWIPFCLGSSRTALLLLLMITPVLFLLPARTTELKWPSGAIAFSGDPRILQETSPAHLSLTTSFAALPAFGVVPRWTSHASVSDHGIWVGDVPPPSQSWKWLSPGTAATSEEILPGYVSELCNALNIHPPRSWMRGANLRGRVLVGDVWTDNVVGDWWFDAGVSPAKHRRFGAFAACVAGKAMPEGIERARAEGEAIPVTVTIAGRKPYPARWPASLFREEGKDFYLGGGLTLRAIRWRDAIALMATRQFIEGPVRGNGVLVTPGQDK